MPTSARLNRACLFGTDKQNTYNSIFYFVAAAAGGAGPYEAGPGPAGWTPLDLNYELNKIKILLS